MQRIIDEVFQPTNGVRLFPHRNAGPGYRYSQHYSGSQGQDDNVVTDGINQATERLATAVAMAQRANVCVEEADSAVLKMKISPADAHAEY
jgi:transposase-like protein